MTAGVIAAGVTFGLCAFLWWVGCGARPARQTVEVWPEDDGRALVLLVDQCGVGRWYVGKDREWLAVEVAKPHVRRRGVIKAGNPALRLLRREWLTVERARAEAEPLVVEAMEDGYGEG